jgi:hypothetical protein
VSIPCPKCGRLCTFDGTRCCNKYCRYGSNLKPEIDFKAVRHQRFLSQGGREAEAIWVPAWYELDPPPLEVGLTAEFAFCRDASDGILGQKPLTFYTGFAEGEIDLAWGTIAAIRHADFGSIRKISTRGLDYTIELEDGRQYSVNAEESPGELYERRERDWSEAVIAISDWRFTVAFSSLAEREPAEPRST